MSAKSRAPDLGSGRVVEQGLGNPFTAAFRATRMAMLITDPRQDDNPIVFVNDAFMRLTGYGREEVLGRNCRFLQGPGTDRTAIARIRSAVAAGDRIECNILNYRKDGSPFWNALLISPVHDEKHKLLYFFASQLDVSDRVRAEAEVERRTRDLQAALDQRTALLQEVDHRMKNNLQVISSLVLLKARHLHDERAQRALHNLAEQISALSAVHRLLYPAHEVGRFDLAEFARELVSDLVLLLPPDQIALEFDLQPVAVPAAKASALALLLNELVGNAVKHAFPDGRRGRLRVKVSRSGGRLLLVVEDDGIGLAAEAGAEPGFGRMLIDMLVKQLAARLELEDAQPGTRVIVTMPIGAPVTAG